MDGQDGKSGCQQPSKLIRQLQLTVSLNLYSTYACLDVIGAEWAARRVDRHAARLSVLQQEQTSLVSFTNVLSGPDGVLQRQPGRDRSHGAGAKCTVCSSQPPMH